MNTRGAETACSQNRCARGTTTHRRSSYDARMPFGSAIANGLDLAIMYANGLCKTIPADKFAHMPKNDFNSPAFCIGHCAIYPHRVLELLSRKDLEVPNPAGWEELFKAGAPCVDKPGLYPSKDELMEHFTKGYGACSVALKSAPDSVLSEANPNEGRMKEMFPTKGGVITFLCVGHPQSHLGQISMWRRVMGLGSAM